MTDVLPPTRSPLAGGVAALAAIGVVAFAVGVASDEGLTESTRYLGLALSAAFAAGLALTAYRLLQSRGGLVHDAANGRLGIGITSDADRWWIAERDILGAAITSDPTMDEYWYLVIRLRGGGSVVLASSDDRPTLEVLSSNLADKLAVLRRIDANTDAAEVHDAPGAVDLEPPAASEPVALSAPATHDQTTRFGVRRGAALQPILLLFGVTMLVVGVAFLLGIDNPTANTASTDLAGKGASQVFGFLIGPLLGFLGLALAGSATIKSLATEELTLAGDKWTHAFTLGKLRWGSRTITSDAPEWRVIVHTFRGAHVELVGDDGVLVLASGATSKSSWSVSEASTLSGVFTR